MEEAMNTRNAGRKQGYRKPFGNYRTQYQDVIAMLQTDATIRQIACECGVSTNTILKVKRMF